MTGLDKAIARVDRELIGYVNEALAGLWMAERTGKPKLMPMTVVARFRVRLDYLESVIAAVRWRNRSADQPADSVVLELVRVAGADKDGEPADFLTLTGYDGDPAGETGSITFRAERVPMPWDEDEDEVDEERVTR